MSKAWQAQITWMACAMIKARNSAGVYAALLDQVRAWPERKVCALAAKLAPAPGVARDWASAIAALEGFATSIPAAIAARMRATAEEIAASSDVFSAR